MEKKEDFTSVSSSTATVEQCTELRSGYEDDTISKNCFDDDAVGDKPPILFPVGYKPRDFDVVCGRNHPNIRFHRLVKNHTNEYSNTRNCKVQKSTLVSKIYDQLVFIKFDDKICRYRQISTSRARSMIALTFRLNLTHREKAVCRAQRLQNRRGQRVMPLDFKPRDSDIAFVDERGESHAGIKIVEARIQDLLPKFSAATLPEQRALVSKLYRELRDQGRSFFHRRACEDYLWHRMSQYTSTVEIHKLFQRTLKKLERNETLPEGRTHFDKQTHGRYGNDSAETLVSLSKEIIGKKARNVDSEKEKKQPPCANSDDNNNSTVRARQGDIALQDELRGSTLKSPGYIKNLQARESLEQEPKNREFQLKAVKMLQAASSQGHANAQFKLAQCFHDGKGVKKNLEKAVKLYCSAAAQFHVTAGSGELSEGFLNNQGTMFSHHAM